MKNILTVTVTVSYKQCKFIIIIITSEAKLGKEI